MFMPATWLAVYIMYELMRSRLKDTGAVLRCWEGAAHITQPWFNVSIVVLKTGAEKIFFQISSSAFYSPGLDPAWVLSQLSLNCLDWMYFEKWVPLVNPNVLDLQESCSILCVGVIETQ